MHELRLSPFPHQQHASNTIRNQPAAFDTFESNISREIDHALKSRNPAFHPWQAESGIDIKSILPCKTPSKTTLQLAKGEGIAPYCPVNRHCANRRT